MDQRFSRLDALFQAARRLPPAERPAFLDAEVFDDASLRAEVEELLAAIDSAPDAEPPLPIAGLVAQAWGADAIPEGFCGFRIVRRLASGGMGVVYEAEQAHPRRRVALKVLHPGAASDEGRRRFEREAEILARLKHPGIAQVHVFGTAPTPAGDGPFLAMELVDGTPLNVHARGLEPRGRLELLAKVCDAVAHAHANGVIHRDLKPSNILVTSAGEPKVLDFGVARLLDADTMLRTRTGQIIGTLAYMSPEQAAGDLDRVDTRSDVYALGVLGYEMLCGRLPHEITSSSLPEAVRRIVEDEPPDPGLLDRSLRGDISLILSKALAKEPSRRYEGAAALAEDIRRHLRDEPILARPPTATYQLRKFVRRHRALVTGVAATMAALVLGLVLALRAAREEERQRILAGRSADEARHAASQTLMEAAAADLQAFAGQSARRRLERIPAEHRDWAWRYLSAQVDRSSKIVPLNTTGASAFVFDRDTTTVGLLEDRGPVIVRTDTGARTVPEFRATPEIPRLRWQRICPLGAALVAVGTLGRTVGWMRLDSAETTFATLGSLVASAAGAPDGSKVAICIHGGVGFSYVHVLDAASGEPITATRGDAVEMSALAFRPDGRFLAASGFYLGIHILDASTGKEVRVLHGHSGGIHALAYSPDGRFLASGSDDKTVVLWRADDGAVVHRWTPHEGEVVVIAWSPDGSRIASGDALGTIMVWNAEGGACERVLQGHEHGVGALAFRDGRTLVSVDADGVREWDVTPGRDPDVLRYHAGRAQGNPFSYVYGVAFSPDGSLLASAGWDMTVRLVDPATNELLSTFVLTDRIDDVSFTADGRRILVTTTGGTREAWDAETGERLGDIDKVKRPRAPNPAWSPDGHLMASVFANGKCVVRTRPANEVVHEFQAHRGEALAVAFDATGERFATGGADRMVRVWDTRSGRMLLELQGHRDNVYAFAFHPDGKLLASGSNDNTIHLWDLERGTEQLELRGHANYIHGLAFSPDGETLVSASGDNTVRLWTTCTAREREARAEAERAARSAVAPKVDALFTRLDNARAVADAILGDTQLPEAERRAALHLVLRRGGEGR